MSRVAVDYQKMIKEDMSKSLSHLNVHDHLKGLPVPVIRTICDNDRVPWSTCILNVTGELNTGTIIRNALLTGSKEVIILGRRKIDKRGTVGSENYINVDRIDALERDGVTINLDKFWEVMNDKGLLPVFVEQGGTMLPKVDWKEWKDIADNQNKNICLVFGNENRGIPQELLTNYPYIVSIPQRGAIRSYNVGCSSAIVMYAMAVDLGWL